MASVADIMSAMSAGVQMQGPELVKSIKGVIVYDIGGKCWTLDLKTGAGSVKEGKPEGAADVTITLAEPDFIQLAAGTLNAQQAFMRGKLKLKGNMAMAMKLNTVLDAARKAAGGSAPAAAVAPAAKPAAAAAASTAPAASAAGSDLKSGPIFDAIAVAVKSQGADLVKKVNGIIRFSVTRAGGAPPAVFTLDLKNGAGSFSKGETTPSADLTLTVSDDDFSALAAGTLNAQQAFMRGKLKIKGSMPLAMKLQTVLDAAKKAPTAKL